MLFTNSQPHTHTQHKQQIQIKSTHNLQTPTTNKKLHINNMLSIIFALSGLLVAISGLAIPGKPHNSLSVRHLPNSTVKSNSTLWGGAVWNNDASMIGGQFIVPAAKIPASAMHPGNYSAAIYLGIDNIHTNGSAGLKAGVYISADKPAGNNTGGPDKIPTAYNAFYEWFPSVPETIIPSEELAVTAGDVLFVVVDSTGHVHFSVNNHAGNRTDTIFDKKLNGSTPLTGGGSSFMIGNCAITGCRGGNDMGLADFGSVTLNNTGGPKINRPSEVITLLEGGFTLDDGLKPRINTTVADDNPHVTVGIEINYIGQANGTSM